VWTWCWSHSTVLLNSQVRPLCDLIDLVFTLVRSQIVATYNRTATYKISELCQIECTVVGLGLGGPRQDWKWALRWHHHRQPTVISTFDLPKIRSPNGMFLRLRYNWNSRRKWKRVFMISGVFLRGGERGTCLGPPIFGDPPSGVTRINFTHFWWKTYYSNVLQSRSLASTLLSKGPLQQLQLKVICFQRGPE